ncbi:DUF1062 domain-containing protein [Nonomuraea sp. SYSU D8015]|uniref:DUF1062 domain-containing protein n=1 Tax=Nonomuraea sp. SYSU D8015 TaxID=2593644 RepID=UPI001CB6E03F|nr:DUF1062 domain-containing protein [Nonomuraea sp. SYSU D8015]
MLPWVVRRTRLPLLTLRCPDCRTAKATTKDGRFRVNANGKLLDVWLLVNCVACDRTTKLAVHERIAVRSLGTAGLRAFEANDPALVAQTLLDPLFARRNRLTLDWDGAWRLDTPEGRIVDAAWPVRVEVVFLDPVPVRPGRLIAQGLGISRSETARRIKCEVPLDRRTSTDFHFVLMPGDGQDASDPPDPG